MICIAGTLIGATSSLVSRAGKGCRSHKSMTWILVICLFDPISCAVSAPFALLAVVFSQHYVIGVLFMLFLVLTLI